MTALRVALILLVAIPLSGCEAIGMVFKAGVWTGVIVVALLLAVIGFVVLKARRPH